MDVSASLRRWFVAHFGVNLLLGAPLLLVPETFLRAMGWQNIDGSIARFGGAALLAVGVQSLVTRDGSAATLRMMLNFKLLWSWAVITGLVFAVADNAPDPVWVLLAFFLALSSVWFHFRMQFEDVGEDEEHDLLPAGGDELSDLMHLEATGEGERVITRNALGAVGQDDINALFAAQAAAEARKAAAAKAKPEREPEPDEAEEEEPPPPNKTIQGIAPEKRAEMDELDALLAASATTGIDDKKAERLADLLAARKAGRFEATASEAPVAAADPEAMGSDDIAAMLANGPEEKTLGSDDIAALLAGGSEEESVGGDDIAAMLAANNDDEAAEPPSKAPTGKQWPEAEDPSALETARQAAAPTEAEDAPEAEPATQPEPEPEAAEAAAEMANTAEAAAEMASAGEAAAEMASAAEAAAEMASAAEAAAEMADAPPAPAPAVEAEAETADVPPGSDEVAALLAGDEESMSSEDLAALLAGNEGGSSEPPSLPTLRGRAESALDLELEGDDESILFADDTPPPEPTEAVLADAQTEAVPGDTLDEAADDDAIAALLAASRGDDDGGDDAGA